MEVTNESSEVDISANVCYGGECCGDVGGVMYSEEQTSEDLGD